MDTHLPLERKNRKGILGWEKPKAWLMDEDRCRVRDTSCTTVSLAFPPPAASLHFIFLHRVDLMSFDTCEDRGAPGGFVAHRLKAPPFLRWHAFQPREREKGREGEGKGVFDRKTLTPVAKKRRINRQTFPTKRKKLLEGVVHTFSFQFFRDSSFQIHFPLVVLQSSSLLSTDLSNFVIPLSRQRF